MTLFSCLTSLLFIVSTSETIFLKKSGQKLQEAQKIPPESGGQFLASLPTFYETLTESEWKSTNFLTLEAKKKLSFMHFWASYWFIKEVVRSNVLSHKTTNSLFHFSPQRTMAMKHGSEVCAWDNGNGFQSWRSLILRENTILGKLDEIWPM